MLSGELETKIRSRDRFKIVGIGLLPRLFYDEINCETSLYCCNVV